MVNSIFHAIGNGISMSICTERCLPRKIHNYAGNKRKGHNMKSAMSALRIAISICLLIGCGGGGGDGNDSCTAGEACDDGKFCNGLETCDNGTCRSGTPPCDDDNACTDDICAEASDHCRSECNAAGPEDQCCDNPQCAEAYTCVGITYLLRVTDLTVSQQPLSCILLQPLLDSILPLITDTSYPVLFPPEAAYPTNIELTLPFFEPVSIPARLVNHAVVFDTYHIPGIDLGTLSFLPPGFNCLVGGDASGGTNGLGNNTMEMTINVWAMSATTGSGSGVCLLPDPDPACTLQVDVEGVVPPS